MVERGRMNGARSSRRMRAAVIVSPGHVELAAATVPEPGAGEVRVRLFGTGVCGSNLPVWEGRAWFRYPQEPGAPGHEGWGMVDAVGAHVNNVAIGQRVAILSSRAYAEYDVAPADAVVPIPAALQEAPMPAEPLACAINVARRSDLAAGQTVAIVGIGFLGAVLTQLATRIGARVVAISRRPFALEVARRCGAAETLTMRDPASVVERVHALTDGAGCERVIEAVGQQEALDLAAELTRERGRLVVAGYHQDGPRRVNLQLWNWRGLDVINAHERDTRAYADGMRAAIQAVLDGTIDPMPLYTHRFPLEALGDAFTVMRDRPPGFLKALVMAA